MRGRIRDVRGLVDLLLDARKPEWVGETMPRGVEPMATAGKVGEDHDRARAVHPD